MNACMVGIFGAIITPTLNQSTTVRDAFNSNLGSASDRPCRCMDGLVRAKKCPRRRSRRKEGGIEYRERPKSFPTVISSFLPSSFLPLLFLLLPRSTTDRRPYDDDISSGNGFPPRRFRHSVTPWPSHRSNKQMMAGHGTT